MGVEKEEIQLEVTINGKKAGKSLSDLQKDSRALNAQVNKLTPGTDKFIAASAKLRKVRARMKQVRDEISNTGGFLSKLKKQIGPLGGIVAGAFAVGKIINFGQELIDLADVQAKAEKQLETALGGVNQRLLDQAAALQKVTQFGDEQTIRGQALLGSFTDNADEIERLTPLVLDMATVFDMDVNAAFSLIGKTLGSSTNALSRYGLEVEGAVGSSERLESLAGALEKKFAGQAEAALAGAGGLKQFDNLVGDLKEGIGALLITGLSPLIKGFGELVIFATKFLDVPVSVKLEEERQGMNLLVMQITDANIEQEERNKLIGNLQRLYPDFLENLDSETATNEELAGRLRDVNEQLVNKIIIQRKEEELADQAEDTADALEDRMEAEIKLRKDLIEVNEDFNLGIDFTNKSLQEQTALIQEGLAPQIQKLGENQKEGIVRFNEAGKAANRLAADVSRITLAQSSLNEEQEEQNLILKEKDELLKLLGITEDAAAAGDDDDDGPTEETDKEKKEREKSEKEAQVIIDKMLELQRRVEAIREQQRIKQLEKDEQEIEQIRVKFDRLIDQAAGFEAQQDELELLRDEAIRLKREEQTLAELEEKTVFLQQLNTLQLSADDQEIKAVEDKYAILIEQAEQFGLDSTSLKTLQNQEITALILKQNKEEEKLEKEKTDKALEERAKRNAAEKVMLNQLGSLFHSAAVLAARDEEELAAFSKVATLFQIALDTAAAIGSLTAASSANPANAVTVGAAGAAQFVTGLAAILSNIARAKQILTSEKAPRAALAEGGKTPGHATLAWVGEVGTEWMAPNWMVKNPLYANTIGMLEHARINKIGRFQEGGPTGSLSDSQAQTGIAPTNEQTLGVQKELTAAVNRLTDRLDNPIPSRAFFTPQEIQDINQFNEELADVIDESNIS